MPTAFVTGGTGFVGLNLVSALKQDGWRVVAVHRARSATARLAALGAELRRAELSDPAGLEAAMPERVDAVFHVAGDLSWCKVNDERQRRVNVDGTRHVVQAALARGAKRFVHTSSVAAYGLGHEVLDERTVSTAPASAIGYIRTKWLGEQEVRKGIARGLSAVILNPGPVLGPYNTTSWAQLCAAMKQGKFPGVPTGSASYCHAREVARAHIRAAAGAGQGEQYLIGGTDATYSDLTDILADLLRVRRPRPVPEWLLRAAGLAGDAFSSLTGKESTVTLHGVEMICARWRADCSKSERELGVQRVPLHQMAEDTLRWLVDEKLV